MHTHNMVLPFQLTLIMVHLSSGTQNMRICHWYILCLVQLNTDIADTWDRIILPSDIVHYICLIAERFPIYKLYNDRFSFVSVPIKFTFLQ